MKGFSSWSLGLKGGIGGLMLTWGAAQAAPPLDLTISSPAGAEAFSSPEPFVFAGQTLNVHSSFATERRIELERLAPVMVGADTRFELNGPVVSAESALWSAALEKRGPGTLALTGENSYGSNTVLREGRLSLAGGSALGDSLFNLEQHAGTVLDLQAGARVANLVQVLDTRPGDMPLPGLEGQVEWRVEAGEAALSHNINAMVPVRKTGAGLLRLQGLLQGHSDLYIDAGALAVDDMAAARLWVAEGARLEGKGAVLQAHVGSGGMLAPGGRDAVATLTAWGNVVFEPGSVFHVNVLPDGESDLLQVGGTAGLEGGVWAEAGAGEWAPEQRYTILTAQGGLNGSQFAAVETNLAFLDPTLQHEPNAVYLTLSRNDLGAGDLGDTPADKDVGDAIDPPEPGEPAPQSEPESSPEPEDPRPPVVEPPVETPAPPVPPKPKPEPPKPEPPKQEPPKPVAPEPEPSKPVLPEPEPPRSEPPTPKTPKPETPPPVPEPDPVPVLEPEPEPAPESEPEPENESPALEPVLPEPAPPDPVQTDNPVPDQEPSVAELRPLTPLQQAMQGMSVQQVRTLLRESSGSWHASVRSQLLEDGRHVRQAVLEAGRTGRCGQAAGGLQGQQKAASAFVSGGEFCAWGQVYSANGRREAVDEVAGDRYRSRGLILGLDASWAGSHWRPGAVLAAQQMQQNRAQGTASAQVDSRHVGVTLKGELDGLRLTTALLRSWHRIDSRRRVAAGPLQALQRSSYAGRSWQAVFEIAPHLRTLQQWGGWLRRGLSSAGSEAVPPVASAAPWRYGVENGRLDMGPYLRHEWARLRLPAHTETGGLAVHGVDASSSTLNTTTLGWRLRYGWQGEGGPSWLAADLGWRRGWDDGRVSSTQRFVSDEQAGFTARPFTSQGQPLSRNALSLNLEAGLALKSQGRLALRYSGLYSGTRQEHAAWADFRWAF